ncbi:MAG: UDP-N-acetylmuramoyl-L-alanine--D-glutamate ligase, partial [Coriobacteriaceae bacterium]|nr:UDP-N-acetylmuramoyl-L-alanine--D-glutamate ligase [Coriobacteriaceae bacterium]
VESITVAGGVPCEDSRVFAADRAAPQVEFSFDQDEVCGAFDLCIASPGIPPSSSLYRSAQSASTEVVSEVECAWREDNGASLWIAVTGTNGKSTTTALIAHILNANGQKARAVGNIGDTCLDAVREGAADVYVTEVSSYQLASTRDFAPDIAVLLNITPDHLSWHGNYEAYVAAKTKVFENLPGVPAAFAILNAADAGVFPVVEHFRAQTIEQRGFHYIAIGSPGSISAPLDGADECAFVRDRAMCWSYPSGETTFGSVDDLKIKGAHNVVNALSAALCATLFGAPPEEVAAALRAFAPLEHRIEPCGTVGGVVCYNDSKATNVDATVKALAAFGDERPIVLLGGEDKGTDLAALVCATEQYARAAVCFGAAGPRFLEAFAHSALPHFGAVALEDAFDTALDHASPGDIVILSPACASFDAFDDFEHRGRAFKALVSRRAHERGA